MLVEVPISVIMPPRTVKIDNGSSSFEAANPSFLDSWITTGIITATTGVLFMKADAVTTDPNRPATVPLGFRSAPRSNTRVRCSSAPVRTRPPMIRNMKAMVQGAEFDSTLVATSTGRNPAAMNRAAVPIATTSAG